MVSYISPNLPRNVCETEMAVQRWQEVLSAIRTDDLIDFCSRRSERNSKDMDSNSTQVKHL